MSVIKKCIKKIYIFAISTTVFLLTAFFSQPSNEELLKVEHKHKIERISKKISALGLKDMNKSRLIANQINESASEYKLSPDLMVAIIKVESSFDQNSISKTGDISLAQINVKTWNKEFRRLKKKKINQSKLKTDPAYAIHTMAKILHTIRERNKTEPDWYLRYHSRNQELKSLYSKKIKKYLPI